RDTRLIYPLSLHDALPIWLLLNLGLVSSLTGGCAVRVVGGRCPGSRRGGAYAGFDPQTPRPAGDLPQHLLGAGQPARLLAVVTRSEEHTSELQSRGHLVCR